MWYVLVYLGPVDHFWLFVWAKWQSYNLAQHVAREWVLLGLSISSIFLFSPLCKSFGYMGSSYNSLFQVKSKYAFLKILILKHEII